MNALVQVVVNAGTIFNRAIGDVEFVASRAAREDLLPPVVARRHRVATQRTWGQGVRRLVAHVVGVREDLEVLSEELVSHRGVEAIAIVRTIRRGVVAVGEASAGSRNQALVATVAQLGTHRQNAAQGGLGCGAGGGDL